jgi:hypothetical protein
MTSSHEAWLDDDGVRATSSGAVTKPDTYNYRTFLPVPGGLYCEAIFGPVGWTTASAGIGIDTRADRWGHVELGLPTPWGAGPQRSVILVVPPAHRAFEHLPPEEAQQRAKARRDELVHLDASGQWPYSDALDEILAEEGLDAEVDVVLDPPRWLEPALDVAYRSVVDAAGTRTRLAQLGAPPEILHDGAQRLAAACARLHIELERADLPGDVRRLALARTGSTT